MLNDPRAFGFSTGCSRQGTSLGALASRWDVVVVGAGVAGATAARLFAKSGRRTLLVDRGASPRYKVCGSCLNARALGFLATSGLDQRLERNGALPLRAFRMATKRTFATIPLPRGLAVSRAMLDEMLAQAAQESGAVFLPKTTAALGELEGASRIVRLKHGDERHSILTDLVVAADGLHGGLLQRAGENRMVVTKGSRVGLGAIVAGCGSEFESGTIYMACGAQGYAGIVRVEGGQLAIAAAVDPVALKRRENPGSLVAALFQEAGLSAEVAQDAVWTGTPPLTRRASSFSATRVLALGDARGYVEPFTGEGMAWALESAHDVFDLVTSTSGVSGTNLENAWELRARRQMTRRPMICRAVAGALRSPWTVGMLVSILKVLPGLSVPFVARMNAETRSSSQ